MSIVSVKNDTVTRTSVINASIPLAPVINSINILIASAIVDDTAVDIAGGQTVQINGTGFISGAIITLGGSAVTTAYVNANTLTFTAPAKTAATYAIYVLNPDGGTAIYIPGLVYSGTPVWTTTAISPASTYETNSIATGVLVTTGGDAPIVYTLASGTLPAGAVLNSSTGELTGTASATASNTTYTFTIKATDAQLQDSTSASFSLTINTDVVTMANTSVTLEQNTASSTALTATSAAGKTISYTSTALPAGLSIVGSAVTGTPTVAAVTATTFTATAATTGRTGTGTITWTVSVAADQYVMYNTLLLSGSASTETFITDASTNNFALAIAGDTRPNNFNPFTPGYYSNYFDGTGDYLTVPSSSSSSFSTGDFTVECWVYMTANSSYRILLGNGTSYLCIADGALNAFYSGVSISSSATVTLNTWTHVAFVRSAGTMYFYINGALSNSTAFAGTWGTAGVSTIGYSLAYSGLYYYTGYISNLRVVNGTAVYTSNFTPPTAPLTAIANTSLLTCQSNRFIDNSSNAFTITAYDNTKISSSTPFVPNTQYAAYGSTYFDGTGDSLTVASPNQLTNFGTGDFTVECWIYFNVVPTNTAAIISNYSNFYLNNRANGTIGFTDATTVYALTAGTLTAGNWFHIALVRNAGSSKIYINGQGGTAVACNVNFNSTNTVYIGGDGNGTINGYIANLRVVKGVAVYTANFTVPTAPLTATQSANTNGNPSAAITGTATSLLTLQTNQPASNSMFLDSSTNAFSITRAGNTSAGTSSPYGANWSNYFAGTGANYLFLSNIAQNFYDGKPLTVEGWFYAQSSADVQFAGNYENSGSGWTIQTYQQKIAVNLSGDGYDIVGTTTYALNTWHHFALSGTAGSWKLFLNGLQEGSTYTGSVTLNTNAGLAIGGLRWSGANYSQLNGYISNLRIDQSNIYTSNFTPSTAPLPPTNTTYILTCNSNRLADTGPKDVQGILPFTGGTVSVQRFSPFSPQTQTPITHSAYFAGSATDYITVAAGSSQLNLPGDFTVELWFYETNTTPTIPQFASGTTGGFACGINAYDGGGTRKLDWRAYGSAPVYGVTAITTNVWHHAAYVKSGSTFRIFLNGVLEYYSGSYSTTFTSTATYIGSQNSGDANYSFRGYISNFRVVKGTAVYTTSSTTIGATIFAVPTAPLTAIANTALLTCQSATFVDNSTNALVITSAGTATPRTVNPFGFTSLTAAYSAATYGASAYFNGTTSYVSVPDNVAFTMGSASYTLECWVYLNSTAQQIFIGTCDSAGSGGSMSFTLGVNGSTQFSTGIGYAGVMYFSTFATAPTVGRWYHVAGVRNGATVNVYVDGVKGTDLNMAALAMTDSAQTVAIGRNGAGNFEYTNGYISNARIVQGKAVYTSNFVPPAAPLTAITNTSLLLNMNSAGVYDSASMNDLETVADAKRVSTHTPYAGSYYSTFHSATTASLTAANNVAFAFPGEFTVEGWFNWSTLPAAGQAIGSLVANGFNFTYGSGSVSFNIFGSGSIATATYTFVVGVWYHIAMTRNAANTCTVWINGMSSATGTNATSFAQGTWLMYGGSNNGGAGYISNLRVVKGVAVYTANFTPPTAPLTATQSANTNGNPSAAITGAQTSLLTCQSNRFVDNSSNLFAITRNGDTSVQSFNPFQRNSGTSLYFDGTGDALVIPYNPVFNFGVGNFTIEFWTYVTATPSTEQYFLAVGPGGSGAANRGLRMAAHNGTAAGIYFYPVGIGSEVLLGSFPNAGAWHHIAIVRNSTTITGYVDGTALGTTINASTTAITDISSGDYSFVGGLYSSGATPRLFYNGYINDLRITKGLARYNSTFTPPTTAFIAR